MPTKGLTPNYGLKSICAVACLLPILMLVSCGATASDSVVARNLGPFFEAFVGRELTSGELRDVTDEFIALHTDGGKTRDTIRDISKQFAPYTKTLREGGETPAAFTTRHALLEANFFNPDLHDTIELRLFTEPDPVRVVDLRSRRLMTERDVIALANIRNFAQSQGPPRHKELSRRQVDELVAALKAAVGGNSGNMPRFFGEAAAFWAGVQQEWPRLNAEQRNLARAYADRSWRIRMPVEMYGRLWGLEPKAASSRQADDVSARIAAITDINTRLGNLPLVMDAIFGR